VQRVNLFAPEFDHGLDRPGFTWRGAALGKQLGSVRIGGCLYAMAEGERTYPYHFHHGIEEWALVVDGTPVLRGPDGERELRAGDLVCFPTGPEGGHQFRGPGTVLIFSANRAPETTQYPDSGKVGARPPGKVFRLADAVEYWDGE
jgi:uncharacterized cupin superfamily protein